MKKYIVALCLISAASAFLIPGSGSLALVFWSIGFLSTVIALLLLFIHHRKA
jgi:hypothetical protein